MATLSNILRDSLMELGAATVGKATGGTTVTVVDSALGGTDDDYNGGSVIVTYDNGGAAAAPEGEFARVEDYAQSTGTITVLTADTFTAAVAVSDEYLVSTKKYPHQKMIRTINRALGQVGDIPRVDTTTLDTASSQTEYTYALAWKRSPPYQVDIQIKTTDANDNQWRKISRGKWYYVPAVGGTTALLVFKEQLPSSRDLRIWYKGPHPVVQLYSDTIYEGIHEEWLIWEVVYRALRERIARRDGLSEWEVQLMNEANAERKEQRARHKIWFPKRDTKLFIVSRADVSRDTIATPDPP
ncbi:hypothetical protein LCGC14_0507460 [marine sediment metagenome]|uniref:Uncharacterized protein n=1 Tax=marine sediment metagenome TaxID=412755 RepID=A0A0F9VAQ7_9ZZZZ